MQHDLTDQLSNNLKAYIQDTGRDTIRDAQSRKRHIETVAKLSKPKEKTSLDQDPLPMGLARHFGVRVTIPEPPAMQQIQLIQENK